MERIGRAHRSVEFKHSVQWPDSFTQALKTIFGEAAVEIWHLAPLRRSDVATAANASGIDAQSFLEKIDRLRAAALAAKPVTLDLLLKIRRDHGALPASQVEIYSRGLQALCAENNASRREWGAGRCTIGQRLAVARRLAALSLLCRRPFIQSRESADVAEAELLTLEEILKDAAESVDGSRFAFGIHDVQEVLETGLFRNAANNRVTWAHQTYAEFLAADYLKLRGLTREQITALITLPAPESGRVAPELIEVAAWLASLDPTLGEALRDANPDAMLVSDVVAGDETARVEVARRYLAAIARHDISEDGWDEYYPRLAGAGLAEILRPYLTETAQPFDAREAALRIAGACRCADLGEDLIALALDEGQAPFLRGKAVDAIAALSSPQMTRRLEPLLAATDDDLRGAAILALWPGVISTEKMLAALHLPTPGGYGHYRYFIQRRLIDLLPGADLPVALG